MNEKNQLKMVLEMKQLMGASNVVDSRVIVRSKYVLNTIVWNKQQVIHYAIAPFYAQLLPS